MSFELSWYLPKRIIYIQILGELDLSGIEALSRVTSEYMNEGNAPVHILMDDAKGGKPPISLKDIKSRLDIVNHPSVGWVIGVGEADPVAKFLIPLLMKIVNLQYIRLANVDEALKFLSKQDMTLQELSHKS